MFRCWSTASIGLSGRFSLINSKRNWLRDSKRDGVHIYFPSSHVLTLLFMNSSCLHLSTDDSSEIASFSSFLSLLQAETWSSKFGSFNGRVKPLTHRKSNLIIQFSSSSLSRFVPETEEQWEEGDLMSRVHQFCKSGET